MSGFLVFSLEDMTSLAKIVRGTLGERCLSLSLGTVTGSLIVTVLVPLRETSVHLLRMTVSAFRGTILCSLRMTG